MFSKRNLKYLLAIVIYFVLLVVLSRYDLQFSQFMTARSSELFIQVGRRIGPPPVVLIPAFCVYALDMFHGSKWYFKAICFVLCVTGGWLIVIPQDSPTIVNFVMTLVLGIIFYNIVIRLPLPKDNIQNRAILMVGLMTPFIGMIVVEVLKFFWCRPRYLAIIQEGAQYQDMWTISGFGKHNDLYHSFPSAHTFGAACSIMITQLPELYKERRWNRILLYVVPIAFTIFVALSRIMAGKHFISDVMVGAGVFVVVFLVLRNIKYTKLVSKTNVNS